MDKSNDILLLYLRIFFKIVDVINHYHQNLCSPNLSQFNHYNRDICSPNLSQEKNINCCEMEEIHSSFNNVTKRRSNS